MSSLLDLIFRMLLPIALDRLLGFRINRRSAVSDDFSELALLSHDPTLPFVSSSFLFCGFIAFLESLSYRDVRLDSFGVSWSTEASIQLTVRVFLAYLL